MELKNKNIMMAFCFVFIQSSAFALSTTTIDTNRMKNNSGTNLQDGTAPNSSLKAEVMNSPPQVESKIQKTKRRANIRDVRNRSLNVKVNCAKDDKRCLQESELNPTEHRIK